MKGIDLISSAARLAGFLASGEALQGSEPADCLLIAQQMMDEWQADGLRIFGENINKFALTAGKQVYTLGNSGTTDFAMPRPAKIDRMGIEMVGSNALQPPEIPIDVLDYNGWASIPVKNISGSYPLSCYPDNGFPNINCSFWQIPSLACNAVFYTWQPISTFPDFVTDVTFPPAYAQAIKYNLAILLAAEFQSHPDPVVIAVATSSMTKIKDLNLDQPVLSCEGIGTRSAYYDYRSDSYIVRR